MNAGFITDDRRLRDFVVGDIPRRRPPRVPGPPSRLLAMKGAVHSLTLDFRSLIIP